MTPAQSRAARQLLGLTQEKLAEMSDLSLSTIKDFEDGNQAVSQSLAASIQVALEAAGAEFLERSEVRLKSRARL